MKKIAVWAITAKGSGLAGMLSEKLPGAEVYLSSRLTFEEPAAGMKVLPFKNLSDRLVQVFNRYSGHIFIMSTGIVIRVLAPLIRHKTIDPAVVVVDERGLHSISLLSGHIGGANELALTVAGLIGADPVITTATDINNLPAIDLLACKNGLLIENPEAIKYVNSSFLCGNKIRLHDPFKILSDTLPEAMQTPFNLSGRSEPPGDKLCKADNPSGVYIDDIIAHVPPNTLILRPKSLAVGIGCNRNTPTKEIKDLLFRVLKQYKLSQKSLYCLASINIKNDEQGLLNLAKELDLPLKFFHKDDLEKVKNIKNPSLMVEKHVGVKSVCEAAAILSAKNGTLIAPKYTAGNVTVAIARICYL